MTDIDTSPDTTLEDERDPLDQLAEEFAARCRDDDAPSITEYAELHPDLADTIRDLFPTILAVERLKRPRFCAKRKESIPRLRDLKQLGDYRIVREIGRGGMGIVYEAVQESLGRQVALKVFPEHSHLSPKRLERFQREAHTVAGLHHTNIVQVFGVGEDDGLHYFVMQYIAGAGLDQVLRELCARVDHGMTAAAPTDDDAGFGASRAASALLAGHFAPPPDGSPATSLAETTAFPIVTAEAAEAELARSAATSSDDAVELDPPVGHAPSLQAKPGNETTQLDRRYWSTVARIIAEAADALHYAHQQGTVHRDIKPANLLLDAEGAIWVTDFGLAKANTQADLSETGDVVGTLRYMAPEQFHGEFDPRVDLFSLGRTLYELVTLQPAFTESEPDRLVHALVTSEPPTPRSINPRIPRDLETIILKATAREPARRYANARTFADDLRRFIDDRPIEARRISVPERVWRWSRRNPTLAAVSAMLLAVLVTGFGLVSWQWREAEWERRRAENNLTLALDSMNAVLDRFASTWMAHPVEPDPLSPQADVESPQTDVELRMVVSEQSAVVLQDVLPFYADFAEQNSANPRLRREIARVHRRIGEIRERLGQYELAENAYRDATETLRQLLDPQELDEELTADAARIANELAVVLRRNGKHDEAADALRDAERLLERCLQFNPASAECRFVLAQTYINRRTWGRRYGNGSDRALQLLQELTTEEPANPRYKLEMARLYRSMYATAAFAKEWSASEEHRAATIKLLDELVSLHPDVPDYRCELAETLAMVFPGERNAKNAVIHQPQHQRAVDLATELADQYPEIPRYQSCLARAQGGLGVTQRAARDFGAAVSSFRDASAMYRTLADQFPRIGSYRFLLMLTALSLGETLAEDGQWEESEAILTAAITRQEQQEQRRGSRYLARYYDALAVTRRGLGNEDGAVQAEQAANDLRERANRRRRDYDKTQRSRVPQQDKRGASAISR